MKNILVNFSGHTLSEAAMIILEKNYSDIINCNSIEVNFEKEIAPQIEMIFNSININIDGSDPLTIIPPGQSTLAILICSFIHGVIGHFPKICYLNLIEQGVYVPNVEYSIDIQPIRINGRKYRNNII